MDADKTYWMLRQEVYANPEPPTKERASELLKLARALLKDSHYQDDTNLWDMVTRLEHHKKGRDLRVHLAPILKKAVFNSDSYYGADRFVVLLNEDMFIEIEGDTLKKVSLMPTANKARVAEFLFHLGVNYKEGNEILHPHCTIYDDKFLASL